MTISNSLRLTGLHHVSLRVADLDRSLALYRDVLGFAVTRAFVLLERRFAMLETGNGLLELVEWPEPVHPARDDDVIWHFALRTTDIDRSFEAVSTAGYRITRPITALDLVDTVTGDPFSLRVAFFQGPDGEDVELLQDGPR